MARYFFHVYNGHGVTRDDEGVEIDEAADARCVALSSIRSIVADEARDGLLDLTGHIEVADQNGDLIFKTQFKEAFNLRLP